MISKLDLNSWERADHFHFFRQFEEPFFGVCVTVDCSNAYSIAKSKRSSFFLYYLFQSLRAANEVVNFRYRIQDNVVLQYDQVHASPTINRPNGTFGFAYMDFEKDFPNFEKKASIEIERVQQSTGLVPAVSGENVIHYSSLPWIKFTGISHARSFTFPDSCPKISFGKMTEQNTRRSMPVSIHVHHALMDGYHVGQFLELFQKYLNEG